MTVTTEISAALLEEVEMSAWRSFYRAAWPETASACGVRRARIGGAFVGAVTRADVLALNRVLGLGAAGNPGAKEIDEIVRFYRVAGVPRFIVQVPPRALGGELEAALHGQGLRPYNRWVKLSRGVAPLAETPSDLRVDEIGPERAHTFGRLVSESFGWPGETAPWIAETVGMTGWRHYLAYQGREPAATGALYVEGRTGWIDFATTRPEFRGRGAQSTLIRRRIRDAGRDGCHHVVVEAAEETPGRGAPSTRNLCRLGFQVAYLRQNYIFQEQGKKMGESAGPPDPAGGEGRFQAPEIIRNGNNLS